MSESKSKRNSVKNEAKETEIKSSAGQTLGSLDNPKPGQRYITPSPGNGDRVFYETLLDQRPDSEMAQDWCLHYGVLEEFKAAALLNKVSKRKAK